MRRIPLACLAFLTLVSCQQPAATKSEDKLLVFAAASLRDAFTTISDDFKRAHPGVEVTLNFAGTQELRTQLEHGAPADVFAAADQRHMDELALAKRVQNPQLFARNQPVVVVAKAQGDEPGQEDASPITTFFDLPRAKRIVIGAPEVPIGRYTLQILDHASRDGAPDFRARVLAHVVSNELNVRQVLAKVALGEADAGIVYSTDARSAKDQVTVVQIPSEVNVIADYPIAIVVDSKSPTLAKVWVDLVTSAAGQRSLQQAGFVPASAPR